MSTAGLRLSEGVACQCACAAAVMGYGSIWPDALWEGLWEYRAARAQRTGGWSAGGRRWDLRIEDGGVGSARTAVGGGGCGGGEEECLLCTVFRARPREPSYGRGRVRWCSQTRRLRVRRTRRRGSVWARWDGAHWPWYIHCGCKLATKGTVNKDSIWIVYRPSADGARPDAGRVAEEIGWRRPDAIGPKRGLLMSGQSLMGGRERSCHMRAF